MSKVPLQSAIQSHQLPEDFIATVERFYYPIARDIARRAMDANTTLLIGVQGCQGSGKSTLSDFLKLILEDDFALTTSVLSIDDFYLTKKERNKLAQEVHPLLETRGVPGTHDVKLALSTMDKLRTLSNGKTMPIPRFDKATDDRAKPNRWDVATGPINIIILEGWCVGLKPQEEHSLMDSVNTLESEEDHDGRWRRYVNSKLRTEYQDLFRQLQRLIVLSAPSFESVYQWRLKQERKLIEKLTEQNTLDHSKTMAPGEILRFISHYQRLTEHALKSLHKRANYVLTLTEDHHILDLTIAHNTDLGGSS